MTYKSIWQDDPYLPDDALQGEDLVYKIKIDDNTVYSGVSVPLSSTSLPLPINVSKICSDFLDQYPLSNTTDEWLDLGGYNTFDVYHNDTLADTMNYYNDWSYDNNRESYTNLTVLNEPINGNISHNCLLPISVYQPQSVTGGWNLYITTPGLPISLNILKPDTEFAYYLFSLYPTTTTLKTITLQKSNVNYVTYNYLPCGEGCLYYKNRYGGWDVFLLEHNIKKQVSYEKEYFTKPNEGKNINKNTLTTTYETSTGWLNDNQSRLLVYHLMSSKSVYYHNFEDDKIIPVNLTNDEVAEKKFKDNKQLINYNITMTERKTKVIC